jgi:DNA-binding IclR family transcriptional regulator
MTEQKNIRSLDRAISILDCFISEKNRELSITEISKKLNLYKSTVHRILQTLESHDYIQQNPQNQKYRLGFKLFQLGSMVISGLDIRRVAWPYMTRLRDQVNETINLNIVSNYQRICVEVVESLEEVRHFIEVGFIGPLYCAGSGKILLAFMPEEEREYVLKTQKLYYWNTKKSIEPDNLRRELAVIRKQGYAITSNERIKGVCSVAAPIRDHTGRVVAGLTISGPNTRFSKDRLPGLIKAVLDTSREISKQMGYME